MTEITIDSYFSKLNDIGIACNDNTTSLTTLQTLINDLATLDTAVENELNNNLNFPTTLSQLRKQILVEIERNNKIFLQKNLLSFIDLKENDFKTYQLTHTYSENLAYSNLIKDIKTFIDGIETSESSILTRNFIIDKKSK